MIRKTFIALAASLMTLTAFGTTVSILGAGGAAAVQVA